MANHYGVANTAYKHGHTCKINGKFIMSPEYRTWHDMKNRCLNPKCTDYHYYGGRGITIDPRWHKFENFLADMGLRPSSKHTLDRIHNNGAYTKANCRWATRLTQARNRPTFNRLNKTLADQIRLLYATTAMRHEDLAKKFGVSRTLISAILRGEMWR